MLNNEDEIEYFGFLPVSFTNDLQNDLESSLTEIFNEHKKLPKSLITKLNDSYHKNVFILNNYILRNILKFPKNFKLERKKTDKIINDDFESIFEDFEILNKEKLKLKSDLKKINSNLLKEVNINKAYRDLLKNKEKYLNLYEGVCEIYKQLNDAENLYENYSLKKDKTNYEFEKLMVYKYMKSEFYKSEKERLFKIGNIEAIEFINKNM